MTIVVGSAGGFRGRTAHAGPTGWGLPPAAASNRACGSLAHGSPTSFTGWQTQSADPASRARSGGLVDESVEPLLAILLGTAVEHATESMNLVHTQCAADGSSRYGTHQSPSLVPGASMKYGPFPHRRLCSPQRLKQCYDPAPTGARPPTP
jgi:hypothetical protein